MYVTLTHAFQINIIEDSSSNPIPAFYVTTHLPTSSAPGSVDGNITACYNNKDKDAITTEINIP